MSLKLVDVEKGTAVWADNLVNLNKSVIQFYLPFELADADTSLLNHNEKRLIHYAISDENLDASSLNYYITSIVSLAKIRRSLEIDADMRYAAELSVRLQRFKKELERELERKIAALREAEAEKLVQLRADEQEKLNTLRDKEARRLAEFRKQEEERIYREHNAAMKRLTHLKSLVGPVNYGAQLNGLLQKLGKVLNELEVYSNERQVAEKKR